MTVYDTSFQLVVEQPVTILPGGGETAVEIAVTYGSAEITLTGSDGQPWTQGYVVIGGLYEYPDEERLHRAWSGRCRGQVVRNAVGVLNQHLAHHP